MHKFDLLLEGFPQKFLQRSSENNFMENHWKIFTKILGNILRLSFDAISRGTFFFQISEATWRNVGRILDKIPEWKCPKRSWKYSLKNIQKIPKKSFQRNTSRNYRKISGNKRTSSSCNFWTNSRCLRVISGTMYRKQSWNAIKEIFLTKFFWKKSGSHLKEIIEGCLE